MSRHLVVIPCGAAKLPTTAPARELYTGAQFRLGLAAGEALAGRLDAQLVILSALYGLLTVNAPVPPYDLRMGATGSVTPELLAAQLAHIDPAHVHALTPKAYTAAISQAGKLAGVQVTPYLAGTRGLLEQRSRLARIRRGELVQL